MRITSTLVFVGFLMYSCNQPKDTSADTKTIHKASMTQELIADMEWMNPPDSFQLKDSTFQVTVTKGTDFFNSPEDNSIVATAPYLYTTVEGDFVAKALVQPDFSSQWNAVSLFMHIDSLNWIKLGFENSDATGPGIVTVVTKSVSDDSNGVILNDAEAIGLALIRKGNIYALHWSKDGKNYKMARITAMNEAATVKIGLEAQCPVGDQATHSVLSFDLQKRTIEDMRNFKD